MLQFEKCAPKFFVCFLTFNLVYLSIYLFIQHILNELTELSVSDSAFWILFEELTGNWHRQELQALAVIADKTFPSIFVDPFISVLFLEHGLLNYT